MTVSKSRLARYLNPVLEALRVLGGSASARDVYEWIGEALGLSEAEMSERNSSGTSKFENDVAWARFYLVRSGYLQSAARGVWSLTEKGHSGGHLSDAEVVNLIREVQSSAASVATSVRRANDALNASPASPHADRRQQMEKAKYLKVGVEPRLVRVTSEAYVIYTSRGYAPVFDVEECETGEGYVMFISARSLAQQVESLRKKNGGQFTGLEFWVRKKSDDQMAAYIVEEA